MNNQKFYFITVFQKYDEYGPHGMRCLGFYDNWNDANEVLHNNLSDLWETIYNYGVIEEYKIGINNYTFERWFYKYNINTNKYELINEPKELEHYAGFALG